MPTGDGLLARLAPVATIALDDVAELCRAAREFGNGIVEITARGNIQIRGVRPDAAEAFAQSAAVDGTGDDGVAVLTDPLAGLGAEPSVDVTVLADELRTALASQVLAARLSPKISIVIDGGTALHLDAIAADVRLRADSAGGFHVAVGGSAPDAIVIGGVRRSDAVALVLRLLDVIAERGRIARARAIVQSEGVAAFAEAARALVTFAPRLSLRGKAQPIGRHALRDGSFAVGLGLAFGHTTASVLEQLVAVARQARAHGLRTAPRCLLVTGVPAGRVTQLVEIAEQLGFVTAANDPRLHVAACAGAPLCASGEIATRTLAPDVAAAATSLLDGTLAIHLSGCGKGCAHAGTAALTIVGSVANTCRIVLSGTTTDAAIAEISADALPQTLARLARAIEGVAAPGESASATLARLDAERIAAALAEPRP